jgi:hypothetical protein
MLNTYVVEIRFDRDNEARLAVRPSHREFLAELHDSGRLLMAGPFADDSGALLLFSAESEELVSSLIEADPYARAGVVTYLAPRQWVTIIPA